MSFQCCFVFFTSIVSASWLSAMISSLASASKWHFNISPLRTELLWETSIYWSALHYIFLSFSSMLLERFEFYENKTLSLLDTFPKLLINMKSKYPIYFVNTPYRILFNTSVHVILKKIKSCLCNLSSKCNNFASKTTFLFMPQIPLSCQPLFSNRLASFCCRRPIFHGPMNSKWILSSPALPFSSLNILFH